ncbi:MULTISPECIES: helix-turn-helix domain-containing protein [unclassified Lentilitoribacter]|jgi:predicted transcriptional regulator/transcriptional regulator with XRE-family HTH domain|uniref:helix-turn-helix domain-containing protein n=1 Tax=unclassified Lentilitoribacter TaxID=2647570 RepID=UPI0013A705F0|nr:helix-turn-helix transcriptional regulator [Lentilitoribacter sp. Alg239-R112]
MADQKVFLGPRVRRIRNSLGLTQTAMAEDLGISPSYLNLIERNQRPLTVPLIIKLSSVYKIDPQELQVEGAGTLSALKEVFNDPLLIGELPGDQELVEVADAAPNAASGMVKLYRAYTEQLMRLSDLSAMLAKDDSSMQISGSRLPIDTVRNAFEERPNYFGRIDEAAEKFSDEFISADEPAASLRDWLKAKHGITIKVLPVRTMPSLRRRLDRHSMRLFISARLSPHDRLREIAIEAGMLALAKPIQDELEGLNLQGEEAIRIARAELARYAAHALIMPYAKFQTAAKRYEYDIDALSAQFNVSFEQVATRLTTLQRPDLPAVPYFLLEVDNAGNIVRRAGAKGYPRSQFGGACPKHSIYSAFALPGQVFTNQVKLPDGTDFITLSRTVDGLKGSLNDPVRRTAIMLCCSSEYADQIGYSSDIGQLTNIEVGPTCRLCERQGCVSRAEPSITRPLGLDEMVSGLSAFDF